MAYRLGLDIGANSIGWCCLKLNEQRQPCGILDAVRIFPDGRNPKDKTSLAAARRLPRSMRRNRDRYLRRRTNLLNALTRFGLMPGDEVERRKVTDLDPYALRAKALDEYLIDTAAGSCGFTVHSIFHVWGNEFTANDPTKWQADYANSMAYAIDFDPRSIKIAKALINCR